MTVNLAWQGKVVDEIWFRLRVFLREQRRKHETI